MSVSLFFQINFDQDNKTDPGKSRFFTEATGTVGKRKKMNAIGFTTQNVTDNFFRILTKRFGAPLYDNDFIIYKCYKKEWTDDKVIIRLSASIDIDLDGSQANTVFIFVETKHRADLLQPKATSRSRIIKYFLNLYNSKIKDAQSHSLNQ